MIDPNAVHTKILQVTQNWADAQDEAERAEEQAKALFASLVIGYADDHPVSKSEYMARCHAKYQEAVTKMQIAKHKANLARAEKCSAEVWWEAIRTVEATKRAEMNLR